MKNILTLALTLISINSFAAGVRNQTAIKCEIGTDAESLQRATYLRSRDPKSDVNEMILKTIDLTVEPNLVFFSDAPTELNLIKSFVNGDLTIKIYSMTNNVYLDVYKVGVKLSHSFYGNFDGDASNGGFTGFVGIGNDKEQVAYDCFRIQ